jgi:hypothetical protein
VILSTGTGAGIYSASASSSISYLVIMDSMFMNNVAYRGGGVGVATSGVIAINGSTFVSNTATSQGGAVYGYRSTLTMTSCNVTKNTLTLSSGYGGGIYFYQGTGVITDSSFTGHNSGGYGGGIYCGSTTVLTMSQYVFEDNSVGSQGNDLNDDGATINIASGCPSDTYFMGSGILDCYGCSETFPADYRTLGCSSYTSTATVSTQDELEAALMSNRTIELSADISLTGVIAMLGETNQLVGVVVDGVNMYSLDGGGAVRCGNSVHGSEVTLQSLSISNGYASTSRWTSY